MESSLTKNYDGVPIDGFNSQGPYQDGPNRCLTGLFLGWVRKDFSLTESPGLAITFLNDFLRLKGQYPAHNLSIPRWIHSTNVMG